MKKLIFILCLLCCMTANAYAQEVPENSPDALDFDSRLSWNSRNELFMYGGGYFGDSLENNWMVGGEYMFNFTRYFGLGFNFAYTKADYTENSYYNRPGFWENDNTYIYNVTGRATLPMAFRIGHRIVEADLMGMLGCGTININNSYEPYGMFGAGIKVFIGKPWLALRFDVRDTFHTTRKPNSETELDMDLHLIGGVSIQIPPRFHSN